MRWNLLGCVGPPTFQISTPWDRRPGAICCAVYGRIESRETSDDVVNLFQCLPGRGQASPLPERSRSSEQWELALALVYCQWDALETRYVLGWEAMLHCS